MRQHVEPLPISLSEPIDPLEEFVNPLAVVAEEEIAQLAERFGFRNGYRPPLGQGLMGCALCGVCLCAGFGIWAHSALDGAIDKACGVPRHAVRSTGWLTRALAIIHRHGVTQVPKTQTHTQGIDRLRTNAAYEREA
jgi:hypothetical protein